jgi:hypothetical protein
MDVLPIQASAVPCERVFSSGKETMSARRNRIGSDLMESLQMLKFRIRKGRSLNFTSGFDWNDELRDLESNMKHGHSIPEDISSFIDSFRPTSD